MDSKLKKDCPILTIAIPTYNRPQAIQKQIRLLIPQLNNRVNLIVYDNFSKSSVESLLTREELSKISLVRNSVNVGGDANIARCFENCNTKWLWTLSDDDFVKESIVDYLLELLDREENTVFFNFCKGVSFRTIGFEQLIEEFKSFIVFSSSFTMSSCVYNIEKIKPSLQDYYNNLSSMVGTIIMVLKYVEKNGSSICEFIDYTLINSYNDEVGWDYRTYIPRTRLFLEAFYNEKKVKEYNKTLFLGCHLTNYWLIANDRNKKKVSHRERWELFLLVLRNQGIANALIYCPKTVIRLFFTLISQTYYLRKTK
ncbi:glycosyltransferase family 2 protein [Flavobacterium humidisoli]|uniref:Glycosyltransferase family 2 protein n=1 Tax=Flavobacterium humidisoli TaxID=2937442 RepID=A0ABY4LT41_9FLAO|nr:glycosyltransferase family 2 protein [Flavobacterium humidisoli]UPZ16067.1 glycosyltransferase family 2 protein [Flavobacterium humidisoli]